METKNGQGYLMNRFLEGLKAQTVRAEKVFHDARDYIMAAAMVAGALGGSIETNLAVDDSHHRHNRVVQSEKIRIDDEIAGRKPAAVRDFYFQPSGDRSVSKTPVDAFKSDALSKIVIATCETVGMTERETEEVLKAALPKIRVEVAAHGYLRDTTIDDEFLADAGTIDAAESGAVRKKTFGPKTFAEIEKAKSQKITVSAEKQTSFDALHYYDKRKSDKRISEMGAERDR